jgi:hypothetical protein
VRKRLPPAAGSRTKPQSPERREPRRDAIQNVLTSHIVECFNVGQGATFSHLRPGNWGAWKKMLKNYVRSRNVYENKQNDHIMTGIKSDICYKRDDISVRSVRVSRESAALSSSSKSCLTGFGASQAVAAVSDRRRRSEFDATSYVAMYRSIQNAGIDLRKAITSGALTAWKARA